MESDLKHQTFYIGARHSPVPSVLVLRIGQLASEMRLSTGGQSIGGGNGRSAQKDACSGKNADELTNWDGTKKKGLGGVMKSETYLKDAYKCRIFHFHRLNKL